MYYVRNDDPTHRCRIGIIDREEINKSVTGFTPYSDETVAIQLK